MAGDPRLYRVSGKARSPTSVSWSESALLSVRWAGISVLSTFRLSRFDGSHDRFMFGNHVGG